MSGIKIPTHANNTTKEQSSSLSDLFNKDIQLFSTSWSDNQKEQFYAELSTLLKAGLDVRLSLDMIIDSHGKSKTSAALKTILEAIINGESLSHALSTSGKFSSYEYFSVQIGEESGQLATVLENLAVFFKKKIKQRRQIVSALAYPVIVLFTAFGAILFMMYFIVPMFSDVFKRFGGELPYLTQVIISISNGIMDYFPYFLVIVSLLIGFIFINKGKPWLHQLRDTVVTQVPFFGELYRKSSLAQFNTIMSLLTGANIHLLQAIELTEKIVSYYPIKIALGTIKKEVLQGTSFHESIAPYKVFDKKMVSLIKVGEEVNQLEKFFNNIAENYSDEVDHKTSVLGNFIEPLLLIFLGFVVGTILIAMYLPMFKLSSSFS